MIILEATLEPAALVKLILAIQFFVALPLSFKLIPIGIPIQSMPPSLPVFYSALVELVI